MHYQILEHKHDEFNFTFSSGRNNIYITSATFDNYYDYQNGLEVLLKICWSESQYVNCESKDG